MFDDNSPYQYPGVQGRPSCLFGRIMFVEKVYQIVPWNLGAE
jgi:hypothetical protein